MDIHKPKPWHGVREFLKEYVIIVVGVLTALAAEQAVEWLHWRYQVLATEEALRPEVQRNLLDLSERVLVRPCLAQRTVELRNALLQSDGHWRANPDSISARANAEVGKSNPSLADVAANAASLSGQPMPRVYGSILRPWPDTAFQAALITGVFNHMPRERTAFYARLYRGIALMRERQESERPRMGRLSALAFDGTLSPGERTAYLNELGHLDFDAAGMAQTAAQTLIEADKAGFRPRRSEFEKRFSASWRFAPCQAALPIPLAEN